MTGPAGEIRAAADKIRALAATATDGPWHQSGIGDYGWTVDTPNVFIAETEDSEKGRADADWIAAMHPGIGLLLARWLDSWGVVNLREHAAMQEDARYALLIARAINAGGRP